MSTHQRRSSVGHPRHGHRRPLPPTWALTLLVLAALHGPAVRARVVPPPSPAEEAAPGVPGAAEILEYRSGTTTQIDQVPDGWWHRIKWFSKRNWPANTLIVHRLLDDNGTTKWNAEVFSRQEGGGFVTTGAQGQHEWVV